MRNHPALARLVYECRPSSKWGTGPWNKSLSVNCVSSTSRSFGVTRHNPPNPIRYRDESQGPLPVLDRPFTLARTISCPSPLTTESSDVVAKLSTIRGIDPNPLVVTILFTPSYFSWAAPSSAVVSSILGKTFFADHLVAVEDVQVDVIVAIVDRVLDLKSLGHPQNVEGNGEEGISMLVCRQKKTLLEDDVFTNQLTTAETEREDTMTIEQKDCLSVAVTQDQSHQFRLSIPLANTVFQNGQKSTLVASRWLASAGTRHFTKQEEKRLRNYTVELPEEEKFGTYRMSIPLKPLTEARRVAASTGNIIRKIYMDEHDTSAAPASQELEKKVTEYFKSSNLEPHRVSVWALLWTPEILQRYIDGLDGKNPNLDNVARFIHCGASLHRVLSGGGGWGHKQGLLSIDPERKYSSSNSASSRSEGSDFEAVFGSKEISEGWVEMTHPGDFVRFFVMDSSHIPSDLEPSLTSRPTAEGSSSTTTTICFRVMAPNIDDRPDVSYSSESAADVKPQLIENLFSAQSYQGISQRIRVSSPGTDHDNILSKLLSENDGFSVYETKLDTPFSFVEAQKDSEGATSETST